jgi:hypothetical protein
MIGLMKLSGTHDRNDIYKKAPYVTVLSQNVNVMLQMV